MEILSNLNPFSKDHIETEFTQNPFEPRKHPQFPKLAMLRPEFKNFIKQFSLTCYKEIFNQIYLFSAFFESLQSKTEKVILNSLRDDIKFINEFTNLKKFEELIKNFGVDCREKISKISQNECKKNFSEGKKFIVEDSFINDIDSSLDYFIKIISTHNLKHFLLRPTKRIHVNSVQIQVDNERNPFEEISSQIMPTAKSPHKDSIHIGEGEMEEIELIPRIETLSLHKNIIEVPGRKILIN